MELLGQILRRYLRELGIEKPVKRYTVLSIWPKVVGERISGVTQPLRFDGGKLFVRVTNAVWRHELIYYKAEIIQKINQELQDHIVDEIILI